MVTLNPQAEELNRILRTQNATVYELLSKRGKAIYYPAGSGICWRCGVER